MCEYLAIGIFNKESSSISFETDFEDVEVLDDLLLSKGAEDNGTLNEIFLLYSRVSDGMNKAPRISNHWIWEDGAWQSQIGKRGE